ncbi:MAG TPA: S41 family peptidase [Bacteroidales bacterium]|nr:S41 family peptidase [Bacteroidales bacterium]HOR61116.1 S41 family peptidase [Bacteroidales bacterium]HPL05508.1 S41 family peptidase [Bacteroidales bacterium]
MKVIKIIIFILAVSFSALAQEDENNFKKISKEQKVFEFSTIYKELYYNFANFNDCPDVDIDSVYKAYVTKILNSEDDIDYSQTIISFLYEFKNPHTGVYELPDYIMKIFTEASIEDSTENLTEEDVSEERKIPTNAFLTNSKEDFAYIKLTKCDDENFFEYFVNCFDSISQFQNVIVDLSYNAGGDGGATMFPLQLLLDQDTILYYREETKTNNSVMKARATIKIHYYESEDVSQDFKDNYYSYYYNEHFEIDPFLGKKFPNRVEDSLRYKGNVHLIVSEQTPSAAEGFTLLLSQGQKVKTYGKKTMGAFGQPLLVYLDSGITIMINTTRSYDFEGNYITKGYVPSYDYDFSEILKIADDDERLFKLIEVIKSFD